MKNASILNLENLSTPLTDESSTTSSSPRASYPSRQLPCAPAGNLDWASLPSLYRSPYALRHRVLPCGRPGPGAIAEARCRVRRAHLLRESRLPLLSRHLRPWALPDIIGPTPCKRSRLESSD